MSQYTSTPAAPNNQMALTSLISGIVAWVLWLLFLCFNLTLGFLTFGLSGICGFLPVIPWGIAVVTGHMGLSQINRTGESGREMAIIGLIMGYAGLALTACTIIIIVLAALGLITTSLLGGFATPVAP
jgi:hypothetical protein